MTNVLVPAKTYIQVLGSYPGKIIFWILFPHTQMAGPGFTPHVGMYLLHLISLHCVLTI